MQFIAYCVLKNSTRSHISPPHIRLQDLSYRWDGPAMLHNSNFRCRVATGSITI